MNKYDIVIIVDGFVVIIIIATNGNRKYFCSK